MSESVDTELSVMHTVYRELRRLNETQRARAMYWVTARLEAEAAASAKNAVEGPSPESRLR